MAQPGESIGFDDETLINDAIGKFKDGWDTTAIMTWIRTTDWFSDLAETGYVYRGHGLIVRAGTIDVDQSVSLSVDVSCVTDCTVPE